MEEENGGRRVRSLSTPCWVHGSTQVANGGGSPEVSRVLRRTTVRTNTDHERSRVPSRARCRTVAEGHLFAWPPALARRASGESGLHDLSDGQVAPVWPQAGRGVGGVRAKLQPLHGT